MQCHEGIDAAQALYDWDFPRQLLHLRTLEAASGGHLEADTAERSLYTERFLLARPLLRALTEAPCVLLVDEIDRADDEFEAFLLQVLDDNAVTIPELGEVRAGTPPLVVVTSNRTREVHDALKELPVPLARTSRPGPRGRDPAPPHPRHRRGARRPGRARVHTLRGMELVKPPGVAESLDWARALLELDRDVLDAQTAATLGAVVKYHEDLERWPGPGWTACWRGDTGMSAASAVGDPIVGVAGFTRALALAGLPITSDAVEAFTRALRQVDLADPHRCTGRVARPVPQPRRHSEVRPGCSKAGSGERY